jgi:hypothetical protein
MKWRLYSWTETARPADRASHGSRKALLLLCAALTVPQPASSQALTAQQINALNNLQEEFTQYVLYFQSQIACASPAMKKEAQDRIGPTVKLFSAMAVRVGSEIGMTTDAMEQRLRRAGEEQSRITNNNLCINIDSLYARRSLRCKQLGESPETTLNEYMQK